MIREAPLTRGAFHVTADRRWPHSLRAFMLPLDALGRTRLRRALRHNSRKPITAAIGKERDCTARVAVALLVVLQIHGGPFVHAWAPDEQVVEDFTTILENCPIRGRSTGSILQEVDRE